MVLNRDIGNRLWIGGSVVAVMGFVFAVFNPLSWRAFPRCMLHTMTGLYCPGCGTGRAFAQIVHGHWLAALRLNPLTVLSVPVVGLLWITGRLDRLKPVWIWTFVAVLVAFGVLRNLPWQPFTLLKPQP